MDTGTVALLSGLGGIVIGTIGNVLLSLITKRYEYKKDIKKFIFDAGFRHWKETCDYEKLHSRGEVQPPLIFVLFNSMLMDLVGEGKIDESKLNAALEKHSKITNLINEYNKERAKLGKEVEKD